jgi:diacylglycerol kinase family enzyme
VIPAFINPAAGNAEQARQALLSIEGGGEGHFDIREVAPSLLADRIREAVREGARRVLVAGGDGSIGTAAGALAGSDVELAILPSGTLNHLAKDLRLPLDLTDAANLAFHGSAIRIDGATVNGRFFLNTSSVGAYVTFVRARERLERRLGYRLASVVAVIRLLVRLPVFRVTLQVEGNLRDYLTPLVFIGIGERELKLPALGARVENGRPGLHVMVVRRRSGARTLALALAAAARGVKEVARTPALDAFLVDTCRIAPRTRTVAVDGELISVDPPLEYRHAPALIRIVAAGKLGSDSD